MSEKDLMELLKFLLEDQNGVEYDMRKKETTREKTA